METELDYLGRRLRDRTEAGQLLAIKLRAYADRPDVVVIALPRGGVPVGFEVAQALRVPLDVVIVRKLGTPGQEELAMGAIASGGFRVLNESLVRELGISETQIESIAAREQKELERRELRYRAGRAAPEITGRTVLLVDDGIATGTTIRVAIAALRAQRPARIVVAVPVAARSTCEDLRHVIDEVICLLMPESLYAIGLWYDDFGQTSDEEVSRLLEQAEERLAIGGQASKG